MNHTGGTETGKLLSSTALAGGYHVLRLQLPQLCQTITAGQQLRIKGVLLPVMRRHVEQQWVELLYATSLSTKPNDLLYCELEGEPFSISHTSSPFLLIAEDLGLAPITFLAETLKKQRLHSLLVLLGFSSEFPFRPSPSHIMVDNLPAGVIATMPLLEDWSIPCRIAHNDEPPGCFGGNVIELANYWLRQQHSEEVNLYISGSRKMVESAAKLADEFNLPFQTVEVRAS